MDPPRDLDLTSGLKTSRSLSVIVDDRRSPSPSMQLGDGDESQQHNESSKSYQLQHYNPTTGTARQHQQHHHHHERRLHTQYSMPSNLDSRRNTQPQTTYQIHHSLLDERIIHCQLSIASKKDFNEEVRALIDVRKFAADSFILTDINEVRIAAIVEQIVDRLVECRGLGIQVANEAKSLLFVDRSSLNMLLANTMQGLYKSRADGRLAYDNSWIVATGSLASLSKRQVAITRFSNPVNFGRHSQEVRFLIVVLAPQKEKLTKSAWETGRTFATMFTDINFRRRLLRAKNEDEIKVELLAKAETLARESEETQTSLRQRHNTSQASSHLHGHHDKSTDSCNPDSNPLALVKFDQQAAAAAAAGGRKPIQRLSSNGSNTSSTSSSSSMRMHNGEGEIFGKLGAGLVDDIKRRVGFYLSDFSDGIMGERSLYKTISTTVFLYFSVLLPCIAFGVVDTNNTDGQIDPKKTMIGQAIGGLLFALFSGQPLIVIMTTAPLCIYVKVIYQISQDLEIEFSTFYACVGLWMCVFLVIMSVTNSSNLMKFCTRSTEDIFAIFTAFAFGSDGIKEAIRSFKKYYWQPDCMAHDTVLVSRTIPDSLATSPSLVAPVAPTMLSLNSNTFSSPGGNLSGISQLSTNPALKLLQSSARSLTAAIASSSPTLTGGSVGNVSPLSSSSAASHVQATYTTSPLGAESISDPELQHHELGSSSRCQRETCILFLFLMCGTLWLANSFSSFNKTPYLSSRKREILKDYALAISVLIFSFVGSYLFSDTRLDTFEFGEFTGLHLADLTLVTWRTLIFTCPLGFMLSVLFYIDQNICGAMVNNSPYKLKKGDYFHLDLLVLAALNCLLSLTGLPWMHGKLPHSHLHSKALADYEERVDEGHVHSTIVNIRETRLTGILVSILVALSLMAVPYPLSYIPLPVLSGVFLYTALAEFKSNSMVERICLLFTEQAAYPPNHYIRRCPQRKIHLFTVTQILQLLVVSFIGFYPNPYVNMAFPLAVATFVPIRDRLLPYLIDIKYLNSLDVASLE